MNALGARTDDGADGGNAHQGRGAVPNRVAFIYSAAGDGVVLQRIRIEALRRDLDHVPGGVVCGNEIECKAVDRYALLPKRDLRAPGPVVFGRRSKQHGIGLPNRGLRRRGGGSAAVEHVLTLHV